MTPCCSPLRWLAAGTALGALSLGAQAQGAACRAIADDGQRLACYDRAAAGSDPVAAALPAAPAAAATPPAAAAAPTNRQVGFEAGASYADRWELDDAHERGKFLIRPYKPVYVLPVVWSNKTNRSPQSPTQNPSPPLDLPFNDVEAKFQISLKTKLASGLVFGHGDLWAGYTQSSRWQVFNGEVSRPFRETNYEPEFMAVFGTDYPFFGLRGRLLGLSLNHQSNGRADPLSRSWNRVIGMAGFEQGDWSLMVRPWWRIPENLAADNNPDIGNYLGRAEAVLTRRWGEQIISLQMRHSLRAGANSHGSAELEWAFPISGNLRGQVQLFHGYGESLIDYNFSQTRLGLGLSLVEWR